MAKITITATSRLIVEWEGGEQSKVEENELERVVSVFLHRTRVTTWI